MKKTLRLLVTALTCLPLAAPAQTLKSYDVSGARGRDGTDGRSYSGSAFSGANGADGGDAGPATEGERAGSLSLNLSEPVRGVVAVFGTVDASGRKSQVNDKIDWGNQGYIFLNAKGGSGGNGGRGGNGEDGGRGRDGSDATRYSSGSNGENGGHGGDGGRGTNGGDGGDGGKIEVRLAEKDTKLLMLLEQDVSAGRGGQAGAHGRGGNGGSGGSGGSSYSWTETVDDGTDSDGNSRTRTEYHSNSGGMSGSSGHSGSTPSSPLSSGRDGHDGEFRIHVTDTTGREHVYSSRYDLVLDGYDLVSAHHDGVLEPGEAVRVMNLRVRNTGGMPTPSQTSARIYLTNSEFSVAEPVDLIIPKSLAPGESFTFDTNALSFRIKSNLLSSPGEERARWADTIRPLSDLTEVNRPFTNFNSPRQIEITYPIEIEPLNSLRALGPGEASRFFFKVTNISGKDFGGEAEVQRAIETLVKRSGGDLASADVSFHAKDGTPLAINDGIVKAVSRLKAGESTLIEGIVAVTPTAEAYRGADFSVGLKIGKHEDRGTLEEIQRRTLSVRVSQAYVHRPSSDFLLITNSSTTREEMLAWKSMAISLGLGFDIWDLSYNAALDLTRALENGSTLMKDFEGKTIVLLANDFTTGSGGRARATEFLRRRDFLKAASEAGVNFMIVGPDSNKSLLEGYLFPSEGEVTRRYGSIRSFMRDINANASPAEMAARAGENFTEEFAEIQVNRWMLWGQPKAKSFDKKTEALRKRLGADHPERNYLVVQNFEPALIKKGFLGIGKQWRVGSIEIRRTLDSTMGSGLAVNVDANMMRPEEFAASPEASLSLLLSLSFEKKLELLEKLVNPEKTGTGLAESRQRLRLLTDAILSDLAHEQGVYRRSAWIGHGESMRIFNKFPLLTRLTKTTARIGAESAPESREAIAKIAAGLEFMMSKQQNFWDWLLPLRRNDFANRATEEKLRDFVNTVYDFKTGLVSSWMEKLGRRDSSLLSRGQIEDDIKRSKTQFSLDFAVRRKEDPNADSRQLSREVMTDVLKVSAESGAHATQDMRDRTITKKEVRSERRASEIHTQRADLAQAVSQSGRRDLLVPYPGATNMCRALFGN